MPTDPRETLRRRQTERQESLEREKAEAARQAPAAELSAAWDDLAQCTISSLGLSSSPSDRPRFYQEFASRLIRLTGILKAQGRLAELAQLEGQDTAVDHAINLMDKAASGTTSAELAELLQETAQDSDFITRVGNLLRRGLRDMLAKRTAVPPVAQAATPPPTVAGVEMPKPVASQADAAGQSQAATSTSSSATPAPTASPVEAAPKTPLEVFYCYSHKDEDLRDELAKHLTTLKRQGIITEWHDRRITAGSEWEGHIDEHLNSARVILLLVSVDFLASGYCNDVEMKRAMERHDAKEALVIPVILRDCDWKHPPLNKLQAVPKDGRAVSTYRPRDKAFTEIVQRIREALVAIQPQP